MAIINVASIPKLSVFRYPGGKTWFVPYLRAWLKGKSPKVFVEPFAGGGSIGLTVAAEGLAKRIVIGEKDPCISAVWTTILSNDRVWLQGRILNFKMSEEAVQAWLTKSVPDVRGRAFQTILRNRVQRGGIMAAGAGLLREGENGKGLMSRWYPQTLSDRMDKIAKLQRKIDFVEKDAFDLIEDYNKNPDAVFFIDPPYTAAGKRLYTFNKINNAKLFRVLAGAKNDFVMTYDNCRYIRSLATKSGFEIGLVPMKSTHHEVKNELVIGRDLRWIDRAAAELTSRASNQASLQL